MAEFKGTYIKDGAIYIWFRWNGKRYHEKFSRDCSDKQRAQAAKKRREVFEKIKLVFVHEVVLFQFLVCLLQKHGQLLLVFGYFCLASYLTNFLELLQD